MTTAIVLMTKNEARALTARLHEVGADYATLVLTAYEGEAWRAEGHKSWAAYIEAEAFPFSRQRSYGLINQARAERLLTESTGEPQHLTARQAEAVTAENRPRVDTSEPVVPPTYVRGGPDHKPYGKRRRGFEGDIGKLSRLLDESRGIWEAAETAGIDEPLDYAVTRAIDRLAEGWTALQAKAVGAAMRPRDRESA